MYKWKSLVSEKSSFNLIELVKLAIKIIISSN